MHLTPLDLDEARELFSVHEPGVHVDEPILEALHRDARGNPSIFLRMADERQPRFEAVMPPVGKRSDRSLALSERSILSTVVTVRPAVPVPDPDAGDFAALAVEPEANSPTQRAPLLPARPPIRVEDGLVEVGWAGDLESELDHEPEPEIATPVGSADDISFNEELIEDRYAALQAWAEWNRNKSRSSDANPGAAVDAIASKDPGVSEHVEEAHDYDEVAEMAPQAPVAVESSAVAGPSSVRAEPQHDHARIQPALHAIAAVA